MTSHAADSVPSKRVPIRRIFDTSVAAITLGVALGATASTAWADFQIDELYSNMDGSIQFIVMRDFSGGGSTLKGNALISGHGANVKTFTFGSDLPTLDTQGKALLIATPDFAALGIVTPDYSMPPRFLPVDGGSVEFNSTRLQQVVAFASLPIDGLAAYGVNGMIESNVAVNFAGQSGSAPLTTINVVEYYNARLDHYFMSPLSPDIDALDSGRIPGWARTGYTFKSYPPVSKSIAPPPGAAFRAPVCRFYIPPQHGDSHFLSALSVECAHIADLIAANDPNYSGYFYETHEAFDIALPDPTQDGACPFAPAPLPGQTIPVYRLWNQRADSNHRYTTDLNVRAQMIARGYLSEGYGPLGVAMCAPSP